MTINVLIVDDSGFFRRRLKELIDSSGDLKVIAVAENGADAIEKAKQYKPDVITMDYEMPVLDGISAVREIMAQQPTPILMFSSLTQEGARVTLNALEAGAVDFLPKNFEDISSNSAVLKRKLFERLRTIARSSGRYKRPEPQKLQAKPSVEQAGDKPGIKASVAERSGSRVPATPAQRRPVSMGLHSKPEILLIGSSTGGPVALQAVLKGLPANFPLPIVLTQHMPASFTPAFAERLNSACQITVKHAEDGDSLSPGVALLAPGGKQLMLMPRNIKVINGDDRLNYKPCVDVTFASAVKHFGKKTLALILTGMGEDGCDGAKLLKKAGAQIWAQDEASSTIYGMPKAVAEAGVCDQILSLDIISEYLQRVV